MTNKQGKSTNKQLAAVLAMCGTALLTGCAGSGPETGTVTPQLVQVTGFVHGGQQPVSGALIQLYTVGTVGLKSQSAPLISSTVTTDSGGQFNISGLYGCTSATQVYITATGGNPGAGTNNAISIVAALGSCATLQANAATTFINMNEITTAAAAYALAPFAADLTHIGASGSNPVGLVNAFANAAALANFATGAAGGANLPAGAVIPTTELNTLGNIISSCINTTGPSSSGCTSLFGATGASDTFDAMLAIATNPGAAAITSLYLLSPASAPFQPSMTSQPNDFAMAISYAGSSSFATPYAIAIDAAGNAWITNESGTAVTELSSSGTVLATPTATGLVGAEGIALDRSGNVWVANTAGNSIIRFAYTSGTLTGTNSYTAGGITAPSAIALDSGGNAWTTNFNGNSVTALTNTGTPIGGSPFAGNSKITVPTGIALDASGNVYVASGNGYVVELANSGTYTATLTDTTLQGPMSIAVDPAGDVLLTGSTTGSSVVGALSEFAAGGTASTVSPVSSGLSSPVGVASDGTSIFVVNGSSSGSLAKLTFNSATPVSPSAGYGSLNAPIGIAIDPSGSVWTTNSGSNTVSKFIAMAIPTVTPIAANVGP